MGPDRSTGWPADDGTTPKEVPVRWNRFGKKSDDAKAAVLDAADVKERLAPTAEDVRARVADARDRVTPVVADARERVAPKVAEARERGSVYVEQARDWAAPRLDEAKHRAAPLVAGAMATVVPRLEHALEDASSRIVAALESTSPARDELSRRGTAAVAALKGELAVPESKPRWGRRLLRVGLLVGIGAAVFAFFRRKDDDDSWITAESTYATTNGASSASPAPAGPVTFDPDPAEGSLREKRRHDRHDIEGTKASEVSGGTYEAGDNVEDTAAEDPAVDETDDPGGAGFDEAAADATEEPKAPTTPDDPAERTTPEDA